MLVSSYRISSHYVEFLASSRLAPFFFVLIFDIKTFAFHGLDGLFDALLMRPATCSEILVKTWWNVVGPFGEVVAHLVPSRPHQSINLTMAL